MKTQPDDLINAEYSFEGKTFDSKAAVYTKVGEKQGLTKREYFAGLFTAAYIAAGVSFPYEKAVSKADELIKELNKETE